MAHLPPALARVACGDERHTMRWQAGDLVALDHDDPEGELALTALGGTACACVDVLRAWTRRRDDPRLLSALTRGVGDDIAPAEAPHHLQTLPRMLRRASTGAATMRISRGRNSSGWTGYAPLTSSRRVYHGRGKPPRLAPSEEPASPEEDLYLLAGLGRTMMCRLVATTTAHLLGLAGEEIGSSPFAPALEASLFGRAATTVRTWTGDGTLGVNLKVVDAGEEAISMNDDEGTLELALPLEWVSEVWGRDLAIVAGQFALAVSEATTQGTKLRTAAPDLETLSTLTVTSAS